MSTHWGAGKDLQVKGRLLLNEPLQKKKKKILLTSVGISV